MVAVVAAAIVVPARDGLRVVGTPSMSALPADPMIGDCLLEPTADFWADARRALSADSPQEPAAAHPSEHKNVLAPVFGTCDQRQVAGEVVAIISAAGDPQTREREIAGSGLDCRASALEYAGLVRLPDRYSVVGEPSDNPVTWQLSIDLRGSWVLPSPLLQAAGRTWAACVVAPTTAQPYVGSIAGAFRDGQLPAPFGTCWDRPESSAGNRSLACDQPHKAELISTGTVPIRSETTSAEIRRSCEELAGLVMRRADPTAAGGITVHISPDLADSVVRRAPNLDVVCFVSPTEHSIAGSVIGIGDRPVPYAG